MDERGEPRRRSVFREFDPSFRSYGSSRVAVFYLLAGGVMALGYGLESASDGDRWNWLSFGIGASMVLLAIAYLLVGRIGRAIVALRVVAVMVLLGAFAWALAGFVSG